jgi:glycosyltransferase involved in cell wall biosynthesis
MMVGQGRRVVLYSGEHNEAPCDEHVPLLTEKRRQEWFGPPNENDLNRGGFSWDPSAQWWLEMNGRAIGEIRKRMDPTDILCIAQGRSQELVADAIPEMIGAEIMVGYRGIILKKRLSPVFAAFESQSHRAMVYGELGWHNFPREADVVIPNSFNPGELPYGHGGDYLLFVGRIIERKGLEYATTVANLLGLELVVAGPGGSQPQPNLLVGEHGAAWRCDRLTYLGAVGVEERARLMGGAAVTLMPTLYAEPFGGVAVESMMCGTPVVTTDFGAFTETVRPRVSGYRFQTLQEAVDATEAAMDLDRGDVRSYALDHYSLDAVRPMYERWFDNLDLLWDEGFTKLREKVA